MSRDIQLKIKNDIAYLVFNLANEKVNKLSERILVKFDNILERVEKKSNLDRKSVV